ncbi:MAG: hypothetical protein HYR72_15505 [Deltaproteobacteria bacterium]|nr:hypothetical protein [Deltaproteobacteria bacterium]MBI3387376.1 hypothetical protein [Deltaproteobacteria bacterium]
MRFTRCAVGIAVLIALGGIGRAADEIQIVEQNGKWESGYGSTFFNIVGKVKNASSTPARVVRLRAELLDKTGTVVTSTDLYNYQADKLSDDTLTGTLDEKLAKLKPAPIAPGATDNFRCSFVKEETPEFVSHRVVVVEMKW